MRALPVLTALALHLSPGRADEPVSARPFVPTTSYEVRRVEGWTVHVNKALPGASGGLGSRALRLLEVKLYEVTLVVPRAALRELQKVPIWLGVDDGHAPCAEYHPSRDWLKSHRYNPDKAKAVEIGNASRFLEWSRDQPMMVLHELSHAYHDRVLGHGHEGIALAYRRAVKGGKYESVLRNSGETERAYALTDDQEYFAEASEAYFGTNDYYPFVRAELRRHDPDVERLLREVWGKD